MSISTSFRQFGDEDFQLQEAIDFASQSKSSFIEFLRIIEIIPAVSGLEQWLNDYWTDQMSAVFFETYWQGSLDTSTVFLGGTEFSSILDDIDQCVSAKDSYVIM